jgi:pantetheine-phosphate adenylyltransferase
MVNKKVALFPGSFDPFTKGHEDIVLRGLQMFDKIVIAIGYNSQKSNRYFPIEIMTEKIRQTFSGRPEISVETYAELTASFAKNTMQNFYSGVFVTRPITNMKTAFHKSTENYILN